MYGPGSPPSALKHRLVSSTTTALPELCAASIAFSRAMSSGSPCRPPSVTRLTLKRLMAAYSERPPPSSSPWRASQGLGESVNLQFRQVHVDRLQHEA
jgi:hypothetical protein